MAHVNESAAQINARGRGTGIYSFGCIHPDCPDPRGELARIAALGLKGIKLHPAYQATRFDDIRYLRILDRAGELGLVVLTHAGIDIGIPAPTYCDPEMVLRALEQVGPVTLILAHMGGWRQWDQVEALLPQSSVLLDTAFSYGDLTPLEGHPFSEDQLHMMEQEQFVRFVRKFGAQRLLFGTDSPWGDQSADVASIRALPLLSLIHISRTAADHTTSKLAQLMIQGSTMGTVEMTRRIHQYTGKADPELLALGSRLLHTEEQNIQQMKRFL